MNDTNEEGFVFESLSTKIFLSIGRNTCLLGRLIACVNNFARALARARGRSPALNEKAWLSITSFSCFAAD